MYGGCVLSDHGLLPLIILIPNFMIFFVVTGIALSVISCISSVDSSPIFFCRRSLASHQKIFTPSHICRINFHTRSNVGIIAGNRDTVNQPES